MTRHLIQELAAERSIGKLYSLALSGDVEALLCETVRSAANELGTPYAEISEVFPDTERARLLAAEGFGRETSFPLPSSCRVSKAFTSPEPVIAQTPRDYRPAAAILEDNNVQSGISVRLMPEQQPMGTLSVHDTKPNSYSRENVSFLSRLARIVEYAIGSNNREYAAWHRAERALRDAKRAEERWEFLSEAAQVLSGCREVNEATEVAAQLPTSYVFADWCLLYLLEPSQATPEPGHLCIARTRSSGAREFTHRASVERDLLCILAKALRTCKEQLLPGVGEEHLYAVTTKEEQLRLLKSMDIRSYICVPMRSGAHLIGAIAMLRTGDGAAAYDEIDLHFATTYAAAIAPHLRATDSVQKFIVPTTASATSASERARPPTRRTHQLPQGLTDRKLEIWRLRAQGQTYSQIARERNISTSTVKGHIKELKQILGITSRDEFADQARRFGLIE